MLHPKNNRIDYGEQLIPPDGYTLRHAIGTSYALDLDALMVLPLALFYAQKMDASIEDLRYDMLDAISKAADKITVYFQSGQLKVPRKYHHLMAYWEKGIEPVIMPDHFSSFHPKVWVVCYESKNLEPLYRVLVTSRNLTFTRDWDLAVSTEGIVTDKEQPKNKPLLHFLQYLNTVGKRNIPDKFLNDLLKVKFDVPDKFEALKFVPVGVMNPITTRIYRNPIFNGNTYQDEMLVISPFLDTPTIDQIRRSTTTKPYLLSRKEELDCISREMLDNFRCWQFSTFFQDAENYQEMEDGIAPLIQNLHAKLFVTMSDKKPIWYLGSANCTSPAQERNIEFMVELKGGSSQGIKPKDIFKTLTDPAKSDNVALFTEYDPIRSISLDEKKTIDLAVRKIRYDLTRLTLIGEVMLVEGGLVYDMKISIDATSLILPSGFTVATKPLPENHKSAELIRKGAFNEIRNFGGYAETSLSIFLVFEIAKDGILCSQFLLPMEIALPISRLTKIFTAIIDSRDKFLKYLTFLLTGEETAIIKNTSIRSNETYRDTTEQDGFTGTPVYEKLLIASSRFPERLNAINDLVQRLKEEGHDMEDPIITDEFEGFWEVFQAFIKN